MCRISDIEVLRYLAKSLFGPTVKKSEIIDIASVLLGSEEFSFFSEERWIRASNQFSPIIRTKRGKEQPLMDLKIEISNLYIQEDEFSALVEEAYA